MEAYKIQDMLEEDRPYERCFSMGPEALSDAELLAVILRTGVRGTSSLKLSEEILQLSRSEPGLNGLFHLTAGELLQLKGVGRVKTAQIRCIVELSRRMARTGQNSRQTFRDPEAVAAYYMETLRHLERECVYCVMLDTRNRMIAEEEISRGTVNASVVSPREVFVTALKHRAVQIILVHNHPSGDASPSGEDLLVTRDIARAGSLLELPLIDHIIVGDRCYTSLLGTHAELFKDTDGRPYHI